MLNLTNINDHRLTSVRLRYGEIQLVGRAGARDGARTAPPSLAPHGSPSACGIGGAGRAQFGGSAVIIIAVVRNINSAHPTFWLCFVISSRPLGTLWVSTS
jgi:hypothetical protein